MYFDFPIHAFANFINDDKQYPRTVKGSRGFCAAYVANKIRRRRAANKRARAARRIHRSSLIAHR